VEAWVIVVLVVVVAIAIFLMVKQMPRDEGRR
jgi:hypothetical protein